MFNRVKHGIELPELYCETAPTGRFYFPPTGEKYPSVTTVLGVQDKTKLDEWKARVGEEEAAKIGFRATSRGTEVHLIAEQYIDNEPTYREGKMPINIEMFNQLKPLLDQHLDNVWFQEAPLYSHFIRVAGRVDLVAEWRGKLSIIDFKTSKKLKKREWITSYFMQESFYAVAFEERVGKPITQLVTLIMTDEGTPQEFVEKRDDHIGGFIDLRKKYKEIHGF